MFHAFPALCYVHVFKEQACNFEFIFKRKIVHILKVLVFKGLVKLNMVAVEYTVNKPSLHDFLLVLMFLSLC